MVVKLFRAGKSNHISRICALKIQKFSLLDLGRRTKYHCDVINRRVAETRFYTRVRRRMTRGVVRNGVERAGAHPIGVNETVKITPKNNAGVVRAR